MRKGLLLLLFLQLINYLFCEKVLSSEDNIYEVTNLSFEMKKFKEELINNTITERILQSNTAGNCPNLLSCYDCTSQDGCYWSSINGSNSCNFFTNATNSEIKTGFNPSAVLTSEWWFNNTDLLCNPLPKCGVSTFSLPIDKEIHVKLNETFLPNEVCFFEILNLDNLKYTLKIKRMIKDKVIILYYNNSYTIDSIIIDADVKENYIESIERFTKIKIVFKFLVSEGKPEFELSLMLSHRFSIVVIIIIICFICFLIVLIFSLYQYIIPCILQFIRKDKYHTNILQINDLKQKIDKLLKEQSVSENKEMENQREKESSICYICLCLLNIEKNKIINLYCSSKHFFHFFCIMEWIFRKDKEFDKNCPNCNEEVFTNDGNLIRSRIRSDEISHNTKEEFNKEK